MPAMIGVVDSADVLAGSWQVMQARLSLSSKSCGCSARTQRGLLGEKKRQPVNIGIGQRLRHQRHFADPRCQRGDHPDHRCETPIISPRKYPRMLTGNWGYRYHRAALSFFAVTADAGDVYGRWLTLCQSQRT